MKRIGGAGECRDIDSVPESLKPKQRNARLARLSNAQTIKIAAVAVFSVRARWSNGLPPNPRDVAVQHVPPCFPEHNLVLCNLHQYGSVVLLLSLALRFSFREIQEPNSTLTSFYSPDLLRARSMQSFPGFAFPRSSTPILVFSKMLRAPTCSRRNGHEVLFLSINHRNPKGKLSSG